VSRVPTAEHLQQQCTPGHSAYGFWGLVRAVRPRWSERTAASLAAEKATPLGGCSLLAEAACLCLAATSASFRAPSGPSATTERVIDRPVNRCVSRTCMARLPARLPLGTSWPCICIGLALHRWSTH